MLRPFSCAQDREGCIDGPFPLVLYGMGREAWLHLSLCMRARNGGISRPFPCVWE